MSRCVTGYCHSDWKSLSLNLAEPVWKQLAGMNLTIADLSEVTSRRGEDREMGLTAVSSAKHGGGHLWSGEEGQPALRSPAYSR